jgi:hypothetical protein
LFAKTLSGFSLLLLLVGSLSAMASSGTQVYEALGIKVKDVLAGTVLNARVLPGDGKQVACVVTYFTGKRDKSDAVNVRMALFDRSAESLVPIYQRDFGAEQGGYVANGDLQLLDLNRDGVSEIVVCYESYKEPLIDQRLCEVIVHEDSTFSTAWTGPIEYDATKAAREVPPERRDRFVREFDWPNTMRTEGVTLFVTKKVIAVAGERLPEPKTVEETFPLRRPPKDW